MSADGSQLVYSTFLGGSGFDEGGGLAVDAAGRAWVGGVSASPDFPVTPDAFLAQPSTDLSVGFAARLAADGASVEYATLLGGEGRDEVHSVALSEEGGVWTAGYTSSAGFPTTPGAYQAVRAGADDAFLARISAENGLEAATYLGGSVCVGALALQCDVAKGVFAGGNRVIVAGRTLARDFPVTPGAAQTVFAGGNAFGDGFVAVFDADAANLLHATFLGGASEDEINAVTVNAVGEIFVAGTTGSRDFPVTRDALISQLQRLDEAFLVRLEPDLSRAAYATYFGGNAGDQGWAVASDGRLDIVVAGGTASRDFPVTEGAVQPQANGLRGEDSDAFIARFAFEPIPRISAGSVLNAASFQPSPLAPGQIFSVFGRWLSSAGPAGLAIGEDGRVTSELAGIRVEVDGIPAPLLFVSERQVNAVVPYAAASGAFASVAVHTPGGVTQLVETLTAPASPAIFTLDPAGQGAILNQDGSVNAAGNPAARLDR